MADDSKIQDSKLYPDCLMEAFYADGTPTESTRCSVRLSERKHLS